MGKLLAMGLMVGLMAIGWVVAPVQAAIDPETLGQGVAAIESLDQMRRSLAAGLTDSATVPTLQTFREVCAPVGQQARAIAQENGWQVRQVASKYRNPNHKPQNAQEEAALAVLAAHPDWQGFWQEDAEGTHYFRRIAVEASCLACHGPKNTRPAFVPEKYPSDLAYDFAVGDLRGMYALTIPALQAALSQP